MVPRSVDDSDDSDSVIEVENRGDGVAGTTPYISILSKPL